MEVAVDERCVYDGAGVNQPIKPADMILCGVKYQELLSGTAEDRAVRRVACHRPLPLLRSTAVANCSHSSLATLF